MIKDAEGKTVEDAGPNPWGEEVPMGLGTGLDVDELVENASKVLKTAFGRDVRAHEDAGTYCCGFIYYESLANKVKFSQSPLPPCPSYQISPNIPTFSFGPWETDSC